MVRGLETRRGNTIVAVPQRHPMKSLSVQEGDSDLVPEAARKLFKIRYADTDTTYSAMASQAKLRVPAVDEFEPMFS